MTSLVCSWTQAKLSPRDKAARQGPLRQRGRGNYDLVVSAFVAMLLISNVGATKLIQFGPSWEVAGYPVLPIITDGGAILFPLTYVLGTSSPRCTAWPKPVARSGLGSASLA